MQSMTEKAAGTKIWCLFHRGVRLIWVSVLRGSTVSIFSSLQKSKCSDTRKWGLIRIVSVLAIMKINMWFKRPHLTIAFH